MFNQIFLSALNHLLEGANWARVRLVPFSGRRARFVMPPFTFCFEVAADGRVISNPEPDICDVVIRVPAETPLLIPQGLDKVMSQSTVEGNVEFATELSFVLRNLRWDAEEDLSKRFGDIGARRIVASASRLIDWQNQAATNLAANIAEFLTLEKQVLVASHELLALRDDIAEFGSALTRAEVRLSTLSR